MYQLVADARSVPAPPVSHQLRGVATRMSVNTDTTGNRHCRPAPMRPDTDQELPMSLAVLVPITWAPFILAIAGIVWIIAKVKETSDRREHARASEQLRQSGQDQVDREGW
jgi:hypothetical protein